MSNYPPSYQQNYPPNYPPNIPPPPRPPRTWWQRNGLAVGLIGGVLLLLGIGAWISYSLAKKASDGISAATEKAIELAEQDVSDMNDYAYEKLYQACSDSLRYADVKKRIQELERSTDDLSRQIKTLRDAYKDTLKRTDQGFFGNIQTARAFFIASGRGRELRKSVERYGKDALDLSRETEDVLENEYYYDLPVDEDDTYTGGTWESRQLAGPGIQVRQTFADMLSELRQFEGKRLEALEQEVEALREEMRADTAR